MVEQYENQMVKIKTMEIVYLIIYLLGVFLCKSYVHVVFFMTGSFLFLFGYIGIYKSDLTEEKRELEKWIIFSINQILVCYLYIQYICYVKFEIIIFTVISVSFVVFLVISVMFCYKRVVTLQSVYNVGGLNITAYKEKQKNKKEKAGVCAAVGVLLGKAIAESLGNRDDQETVISIYFGLIVILLFSMMLIAFYLIYDHFYLYLLLQSEKNKHTGKD